jgi:hypothetical protein
VLAAHAVSDPGVSAPTVERRTRGEDPAFVRAKDLVRVVDLRGDLHTDTDLTDGIVSLEGMVAAAGERGFEYYAVTGRAPNLVMRWMTGEKMLAQREELRALAGTTGMALLHGTELNIAADGSVDWDEDFLRGFDICVASVQTETPIPKYVNPQTRVATDGGASARRAAFPRRDRSQETSSNRTTRKRSRIHPVTATRRRGGHHPTATPEQAGTSAFPPHRGPPV